METRIVVDMPIESAKALEKFIYENTKELEACADGDKLYVRLPIVFSEEEKQKIISDMINMEE